MNYDHILASPLTAWWLLLSLLLLPTAAVAQSDVELSSRVDRDTVNPGDSLTFEVDVSVEGHFQIDITHDPGLDDFSVHGQMTAPSYRVINGNPHRSLRREYRLSAPRTPGTYTIEAPTFTVGDREFSPQDQTVEVVDDGRARQPTEEHDRAGERAFVDISMSPDRDPFVGEQLIIDYTLYTHHQERRLRPRAPAQAALDGFWVEDMTRNVRRRRVRERRYGDRWHTTPLYTYAAFPLSAGPATIDAIEVPMDRASAFEREHELTAESEPIELDVRPLPDGAPEGFSSGNVGDFDLEVHVDTDEISAGDQLRLTATVEGLGRIDRLGEPTFDIPDDFYLLSSDDHYTTYVDDGHIGGRRHFEYRLMPLEEGPTVLPALHFSYFDPDEAKYKTLSSEDVEFDVAPGDVPVLPDPVDDELERSSPETEDDPLARLHPLLAPDTIEASRPAGLSLPMWSFAVPMAALLLLLFGPVVARPILRKLSPAFRRRTLRRRIDEQLAGDGDVSSRCLRSLQVCLRDGLDLRVGALTEGDVAKALKDTELPEELSSQITELVDRLVRERYSPDSADGGEDTLVEETRDLTLQLLDFAIGTPDDDSGVSGGATTLVVLSLAALVSVSIIPTTAASTPDEDGALTAESPGEWAEVAEYWALQAQQDDDPTHRVNAGTASAHAGDLGAARLHLERAHASNPGDRVVQANLDDITSLVATETDQAAFTAQHPLLRHFYATAPYIALALLWLALAIAVLYRLKKLPRSRGLLIGLMVALMSCIAAMAATWLHLDDFHSDDGLAIVTAEEAQVFQAPSDHADLAIDQPLPAGSTILTGEARDGWVDAELPSGHNGWLKIEATAPVTPQ